MKKPACPAGQSRDPTSKVCVANPCSDGQTRNASGTCGAKAPAGGDTSDNHHTGIISCPTGEIRLSSGLCGVKPSDDSGVTCTAQQLKVNNVCYPKYTATKLISHEIGQVKTPFPSHNIISSYGPGSLAKAAADCIADPTCQGRLSSGDPTTNITLIRGLDNSKVMPGNSGVYYFYIILYNFI